MATSTLKAGAGKAPIGYPENFFPYRGFRGRKLLGVHDDIYARVLLLEEDGNRFLLISLELGDITNEWAEEISEKTGVPADHIWFTVTHNHDAPYANSTWGEYVPDEEKTEPFCRCCVQAILTAFTQAQEKICPAKLRFGEGSAWVNVNRNVKYTGNQPDYTAPYVMAKNLHGYSDHTVSVLTLSDEADQIFAYVVGYAVHSSALFQQFWGEGGGMSVSGDLSGAAMRYVEERSDAISIHLLGAAGDQNARFNVIEPVFDREGNVHNVERVQSGRDMVEAMAEEWGSEVLLVARNATEVPVSPLAAVQTVIVAPTKEKYEGGPPTTLPVGYQWKIEGEREMPLFLLRLGNLALFAIPGELVARGGTDIKAALLQRGFSHVMIVTQCNGSNSYLSDAFGYQEMTFDAVQSHFAPGIADRIQAGALALADTVLTVDEARKERSHG
jgi:hypothetical protein